MNRYSPTARISRFHRGDRGSIPRTGAFLLVIVLTMFFRLTMLITNVVNVTLKISTRLYPDLTQTNFLNTTYLLKISILIL
jgi:hypothetical protein